MMHEKAPRAFTSLLSGSDDKQSIRLRRWAMAASTYLIAYLLLLLLRLDDLVLASWPALIGWILISMLGNGVFYWLFKSGLNLRARDPSLTEFQMLFSSIWSFVAMHYAHPVRAEALMIYVVVFFFGAYKLNVGAYLRITAFAAACYVVLLSYELSNPPPGFDFPRELVRLGLLTLELLGISFLGGNLARLRQEVRSQQRALEEANRIISRQASHDELTEVYNRRYLMTALNREYARSARTGKPFILALIDIDHFKNINDRYGHLAGDTVLKQFAEAMRHELRGIDLLVRTDDQSLLARFGGEEFVLLLSETDQAAGKRCVERLLVRVRQLRFPAIDESLRLSFSAGIAQSRLGEPPDQVLNRADTALYRAKAEGRDRLVEAD